MRKIAIAAAVLIGMAAAGFAVTSYMSGVATAGCPVDNPNCGL